MIDLNKAKKAIKFFRRKFNIRQRINIEAMGAITADWHNHPFAFFWDWTIYFNPAKIDSTDKLIQSICHEIMHAWQVSRGDLQITNKQAFWKGIDFSATSYKNQPWEIEARKMEFDLYREFNLFCII